MNAPTLLEAAQRLTAAFRALGTAKGVGETLSARVECERAITALDEATIAALSAAPVAAQQPAVVGDDGFRRAFYEIADVLEIGARPYSPEIAFQRDMLPRIRELAELAKGHEYQHSVAGDEVVWCVARALWASRRNTLVGVGQDPERAWNKHKTCLYIDAQHAIAALTPAATPVPVVDEVLASNVLDMYLAQCSNHHDEAPVQFRIYAMQAALESALAHPPQDGRKGEEG